MRPDPLDMMNLSQRKIGFINGGGMVGTFCLGLFLLVSVKWVTFPIIIIPIVLIMNGIYMFYKEVVR